MLRLLACVALLAACGTDTDTRPETADYIIEAILAPSCGRAACHSSETAAHNLAFDTIAAGKAALIGGSGKRGEKLVVAGSPDQSEIVTILSDTGKPMPPDSPLPDADIALITRWVTDGAAGLP
jgi:hypothetical protein